MPRRTRACAFRAPAPRAPRAAPSALAGRNPSNTKRSVGQAGDRQRRDRRARSGQRDDFDARARRGGHQQRSGIAHERRAGVGDQRDACARLQARHQRRRHARVRCARAMTRSHWRDARCRSASSSVRVCRVSSASSRSASRRQAAARGLRSCRLPIGVATTNSAPAGVRPVESVAVSVTRASQGSRMLHVSPQSGQVRRTSRWIGWIASSMVLLACAACRIAHAQQTAPTPGTGGCTRARRPAPRRPPLVTSSSRVAAS